MSIPPRLASKLNETLGNAAAGDLVNWLDEMRAERAEVRADFAELRQEMRAIEARLTERLVGKMHSMETTLRGEMHSVETTLGDRIHAVDVKVDQRHAELMRWSFVFWVGAVAAIAALAGALR